MTISDPGTSGNVISGNYIGLNPAGTAALANGWSGVQLYAGAQSNTIGGTSAGTRNVISGNALQGVVVTETNTSGNIIAGNYIGLNPSGTAAIANGWSGVDFFGGAAGNFVGGAAAGMRNLISGNQNYGVVLGGAGTSGNVIAGNYIGLAASGNQAVPNGWSGVALYGGATANRIGGSAAGAGNLISGNANYGVALSGTNTSGNLIQGNTIGLNAAGATGLTNGWDGVALYDGTSDNVVGLDLDGSGAGNQIAFNAFNGIVLFDDATTSNTFRGNNIFSNGYRGINLVGGSEDFYGVTANDDGDADAGPNNLQNYPVITNAVASGASTLISGTLNSTLNRTFLIDVYRNAVADPSGHGPGQVYVGSTTVTNDGGGNSVFTVIASGNFSGQYFTATATDKTTGDTSEFSLAGLATNAPAAPAFLAPVLLTSTGFSANISLTLGQSYRVQATTNLGANPIAWVDLTNFVAGATNFIFLDRAATNLSSRFYRVVSP